jgi:endonuclease V-like protein UPF0215 family
MRSRLRPHLLGIDDGPFVKRQSADTPIVGVMMEGHDLVEAVAVTRFPIDGDGATEFLGDWISSLRFASALHGVLLGGITIAGLGIVDVGELSARLGFPVLVVNRREPRNEPLVAALEAAGLPSRIEVVRRAPATAQVADGLHLSCAGVEPPEAAELVLAARHKSQLPEPLRLAHLIAAALVGGESRGSP